jgi:hypothetical protein
VLFWAALIAIGIATLWPLPGAPPSGSSLCLACGELGGVDLVLNVVLFIPLGVALALVWPKPRWTWLFPSLVSLTVELLQLRVVPGRDASLGDLVANSVGGVIGLVAAHALPALLRTARGRRVLALASHCLVLLFSCVVAWALLPAPVRYLTWVQIQPERAGYATFTGNVSVELFGRARPLGVRINPGQEPPAYANGDITGRIAISNHEKELPPVEALIFRLANHNEMLVQLSQRHDALAVRFRKRGSLLLLRSPTFVLGGVFPQTADSMDVTVRSQRARTYLDASSTQAHAVLEAPVTFGRGWELFSPFHAVRPASERLLRWAFLALLFGIPAAFSWIAWGARGLIPASVTAIVVLGVIPLISGLAPSAPDEWIVVASGMGIGAALASAVVRLAGYRRAVTNQ